MTNYGAKIAELRAAKKMTQAELGAMLSVTSQAVSKWEKGLSEPDMESITKICQIFNISYDEFFGAQPKQDNTATTYSSEATPNTQQATEQTSGVVLAYCDVCDKPLYNPKEYQVSIENSIQHTTCLECIPKKEEAKRQARNQQLEAQRVAMQDEEKDKLKKGLLWGILGAAVLAAISLITTIVGEESTTVIVVSTILGLYGGYAILAQFVWGNSVWNVFTFFFRSLKLPGIIFALSLDGIIFLIFVKILGAILSAIFSVVLFIIGFFVTWAYAMVIFPFALIKQIIAINRMR